MFLPKGGGGGEGEYDYYTTPVSMDKVYMKNIFQKCRGM